MTETVEAKSLPKVLELRFEGGIKGRVALPEGKIPNALVDGKIDRDSVLQLGRMPEDIARFVINADGKDVAYLTRDDSQWTTHIIGPDGKETTRKIERTATKKPRRAGSKMPPSIDPGPDLFSAVTKTAQMVWPDLKSTSRGSTGKGRTSMKDQLDATNAKIMAILEKLAETTGMSIEEVAEANGIEIPTAVAQTAPAESTEGQPEQENKGKKSNK